MGIAEHFPNPAFVAESLLPKKIEKKKNQKSTAGLSSDPTLLISDS